MPPSWKTGFQAHRVAANVNLGENPFLYHKERQAFPDPMPRRALGKQAGAMSKARFYMQRFRRGAVPGGGHQSRVGLAFGFGAPVVGLCVLATFVLGGRNDEAASFEHLRLAAEREVEQFKASKQV
eukprot:TRINITY_DN32605_c0_g1_i1.p2 TRINITY_DN32605_c0_g1~~TRINITY_DN32605_c0_g1_i1.p2  ORF type:complete len:126 (-),score=19.14 TRINITY_DN32605_c0_g1_i1:92-469(-)